MIFCGNTLCKFHDNKHVYSKCAESYFECKKGERYVNTCPNEKLTKKETSKENNNESN